MRRRLPDVQTSGTYDRHRRRLIPRRGEDPTPARGISPVRVIQRGGATLPRCVRVFRSPPESPPRVRPARSRGWPAPAAARPSRASCSRSSTPARSTGWRRGCRSAPRSSRPRTERRRPPRWPPRSSRRDCGWRTTAPGANLALRRRVDAAVGARRRARACSRWTRRRCPRWRGACGRGRSALGNLFRDQLDRYGELELVAERWRRAVARARSGRAWSSRTPTTRRSATSPASAAGGFSSGSTTRGTPPPRSSTPPTRSGASLRDAVRVRGRLRRPPRRLPLPRVRPRAAAARRRRARRSSWTGSTAPRSTSSTPQGSRRVRAAAARALQRLQRARGRRAGPDAGRVARRGRGRARALQRRVRALRADRGRRPHAAHAARQEPGRRERGRPDARRGRRAAARRRARSTTRSPTDATSPGSGTSTSSRCSSGSSGSSSPAGGPRELALRCKYGGLRRRPRSRSCPSSSGRSTAASS